MASTHQGERYGIIIIYRRAGNARGIPCKSHPVLNLYILCIAIATANHDEQKDTGGILYLLPNGGGLSVFFLSNMPVPYHFAVKPSLI